MTEDELGRRVEEILEKGFDGEFARFCAETFSSYTYPEENLAAARMHAFYLRVALCFLSGREVDDGIPCLEECRAVAEKSRRAALKGDRPVEEVFVRMWCSFLSGDHSA